ncbi:hypothetical protein NMH_1727 [Neisseria meningitidis H44/76]|uniref:Uncharacterized protein n=1 Tax=Neisseria meningitidis serogroup B / serotype 15 (strain H44/76) TaxID=909420 RepID=E6MZ55_NEIMH|nr:hypothetical protein NMH_1727 [Neisseria meningitidis H44/76]
MGWWISAVLGRADGYIRFQTAYGGFLCRLKRNLCDYT